MTRTYVLHSSPGADRVPTRFADRLNDEQLAVVEADGGPMLVLAGAGSGKTRTLTYRVARLIDDGVPPDRILLLTFTNRAAREMLDRIANLLNGREKAVWGGTFHSTGRRLVRRWARELGYPERFGLLDQEDAEAVMGEAASEKSKLANVRMPRASTLLDIYGAAASTESSVTEVLRNRHPRFADLAEPITEILLRYDQRKMALGVMDFDDLLINWYRLMTGVDEARDWIRNNFEHVLVDEYQDTNRLQARLVDEVAAEHRNVMVVGDDCQCIYSFRGADFRNILEFEQRYPDARRYLLRRNYRSSPEIVALANASIAHNTRQFARELVAMRPSAGLPALVAAADESQQAEFVAQRILDVHNEGIPLSRIAVLYRAHWQSLELQVALERRRIPFVVRSGVRFFEQKHVKDVVSFLRVAENRADELAFVRVATLVPGLGRATAQKLFEAVRHARDPVEALQSKEVTALVGARARGAWAPLSELLAELHGDRLRTDVARSIGYVVDRFYSAYADREFENPANRLRDLEQLAVYAEQHGTVGDFLDQLTLSGIIAGRDLMQTEQADDAVVLSTVHQAKGLEFHAVFVLWAAEERFPPAWAETESDDLEEERRLFYVALTRAEHELAMVAPMTARERGGMRVAVRWSPFVEEVRHHKPPLLETWKLRRG